MNKQQRADKAYELLKIMGDTEGSGSVDCACGDCVAKRRALNVKIIGFLSAVMGEAAL